MAEIFTVSNSMPANEESLQDLDRRTAELDASQALDRVLVGYSSIWPHNHAYAPHMLARSKKLSLIVAHRPGVMDPAAAARYFSTLDVVSRGRIAINLVSGGSEKDLHREGDFTPKKERYARAIEYVDVMRRAWTDSESFDHAGTYYKEDQVKQLVRPVNRQVPIFMGGESDEAIDFGARHADRYMLWGEPLAGTKERIDRVKKAADGYGRSPQFSLSMRLFLGETDEKAWESAHAAERTILEAQGTHTFMRSSATDASVGRERQLSYAEDELHDDCFWARLVTLLGGFANSAALVGTPDRVLKSLQQYSKLGVDAFLLTTGAGATWSPELGEFAQHVKASI
ncbi:LLM class flavin-dependent oxidoreductase [Rhodococcus sp. G-MC3]|uniref:LLM class flavin-dependent oxidoreductase n=1 Tax=Rhodococcus sp. G-MC3 TaxID=3046209 RepID=UPI0024B92D7D|nr:LLM class flavin-dependent oxidoreductase [Rhodococcus sp. G-MC3]MDJ0396573.1 LLM class flavin-dependent oxidoreductase [Rhodococcus sp. G-MC3]